MKTAEDAEYAEGHFNFYELVILSERSESKNPFVGKNVEEAILPRVETRHAASQILESCLGAPKAFDFDLLKVSSLRPPRTLRLWFPESG